MPSEHDHALVELACARVDCKRHSHIYLGIIQDEPIEFVEAWEDMDTGEWFHPIETFLISFS